MAKRELPPKTVLMPLPTVLVTTISADDKPNIITLAWVGIVCSTPVKMGISIRPSRYSYKLINQVTEFVINIPTEDMLLVSDEIGSVSGKDVDKFEQFQLTATASSKVRPPLIAECPINLECKVEKVLSLGSHDLFIGQVITMHVDEEILTNGKLNIEKLKPLSYCDHRYYTVGDKIGAYGFSQKPKS